MQIGKGPFSRGPQFQGQSTAASALVYNGFPAMPGYQLQSYRAQMQAQDALRANQSLSAFYLSIIGNSPPAAGNAEQAQYLQLLIQQAGSPKLKSMLSENTLSQADLIQFLMENPDQLEGLQGQGAALSLAVSASAAAPSESSASASAEIESDGDADLQEFSQDETMAAPSMCAMGGVSSADKAKPEMQQNLKEAKAISAALDEMMKGEDGSDNSLAMVLMQLKGKEQIIRSCLRRGKGAADDAYKAHGVDPKDDSAVSAFVAQIGKEVITLGINCGLEIEVSEKRAGRLENRPGKPGKAGKDPVQGAGSAGARDEPFELRTQKTEKHVELGVDEVEANPAMAAAILEQLQAMWQQRQLEAASFRPPEVFDLGETRQGSPLDQAFGARQPQPGPQVATPYGPGPQLAPPYAPGPRPIPATPTIGAARPRAPMGGGRVASGDLRTLMGLLGITGQKFSTKIRVYEPNARVVIDRPGQGGVKVNSGLKGKAISVRSPKMVARAADGTLHRISGVRKVGGGGTFMAVVKGEATGAEAAKQLFTRGDGSISIPGTKAN